MQKRSVIGIGAALVLAAGALFAQTQAAAPVFEVASVKPAPPLDPAKIVSGQLHVGMSVDAARVDIGNLSLADLIRIAYKVKPHQVVGPDWMASQRFDILAKMPEGATKEQVPEMLQALLAERFKLTVHRDTKEHSVYALVVGKNGLKMKESVPDPSAPTPAPAASVAPAPTGTPAAAPTGTPAAAPTGTPAAGPTAAPPGGADAAPAGPPGRGGMVVGSGENQVRISPNSDGKGMTVASAQFGQMKISMGEGGVMRMEFPKLAMPMLADMLTRFTDRPVVDMTELKGNYQVGLDLSMEEMRNIARASGMAAGMMMPGPAGGGGASTAPADLAPAGTSSTIFTAVQALGLKLDPRKLPVETIVVDHLEKTPTEN